MLEIRCWAFRKIMLLVKHFQENISNLTWGKGDISHSIRGREGHLDPTCGVLTLELKENRSGLSLASILRPQPLFKFALCMWPLSDSSLPQAGFQSRSPQWYAEAGPRKRIGLLWHPAPCHPSTAYYLALNQHPGEKACALQRHLPSTPAQLPPSLTSLWMKGPAEMHQLLNTAQTASGDLPELIYSRHLTPCPYLSAQKGISPLHFHELNCFSNSNYKSANKKLKIGIISVLLWNYCIEFSSFNAVPQMEKLLPFRALRYIFAHSMPSFKK